LSVVCRSTRGFCRSSWVLSELASSILTSCSAPCLRHVRTYAVTYFMALSSFKSYFAFQLLCFADTFDHCLTFFLVCLQFFICVGSSSKRRREEPEDMDSDDDFVVRLRYGCFCCSTLLIVDQRIVSKSRSTCCSFLCALVLLAQDGSHLFAGDEFLFPPKQSHLLNGDYLCSRQRARS